MQSAKNHTLSHMQKGNKTSMTVLPALEQSTRITNNTRSVREGIEKRIPKTVLHELQSTQNISSLSYQESNFFITQYGDPRKKLGLRKAVSKQEIKVQKPKQKLEVIMGELGQAISRLKNLRQVQLPKSKVKSSESSIDDKEKPEDMFMSQYEKSLKENEKYNRSDTFEPQNQNVSNMFFKSRAQQIDVMQVNLTDGLNKYNKVMENVKERERKLIDLQRQLKKLLDEEERVKIMKGQEAGNAQSMQDEIDYFQDKMNELKMERNILNSMKSIRKRDLEIIKVPYYKDRDVLNDLNVFLEKETENLVDDAKQIDNIRTQLMDHKQEKIKLENQSIMLIRDQEIHKKNEDNLEKVIQQEIEYSKFQQELKIQERKERERQLIEQKRLVFAQQEELRFKLQDLKDEFQKIASKLPALSHPTDVIDNFADIKKLKQYTQYRETNKFLNRKKDSQIQIMKETRMEIQNMQELLIKLQNEGCTVQQTDKLQVEMDKISQEKIEQQINDQIFLHMKAKQDQTRSHRLLTDIKKGFIGILEEFQFSSLSKFIRRELFGQSSIQEMAEQVQQIYDVLLYQFKNFELNNSEIEQKLIHKRTTIAKRQKEAINEKVPKNFSEKEDDDQSESFY